MGPEQNFNQPEGGKINMRVDLVENDYEAVKNKQGEDTGAWRDPINRNKLYLTIESAYQDFQAKAQLLKKAGWDEQAGYFGKTDGWRHEDDLEPKSFVDAYADEINKGRHEAAK